MAFTTKDTRVSDNNFPNFVIFVSFVVKICPIHCRLNALNCLNEFIRFNPCQTPIT